MKRILLILLFSIYNRFKYLLNKSYKVIDTFISKYTNAWWIKSIWGEFQVLGAWSEMESKRRLYRLKSKRRLTAWFGRIKNVKFWCRELVWFLTFCIAEALSEHALRKTQMKMISVYDYECVVVWMVLGAWKIKLF